MRKSLTAKAIVPVALTVTGFATVCSLLLFSYTKNHLIKDEIMRELCMASTVVKATRHAMLQDDRETLHYMIKNIGENKGVERIRIFNKKGLIMFSSHQEEISNIIDKSAPGCVECHAQEDPLTALGPMDQARRFKDLSGKHLIAVTTPIYNEPSCFTAACHAHTEDQQVLGILDIAVSEEHLQGALKTLFRQLIGFWVMVVILSVGGLAVLLQRNVLLPIKQLIGFNFAISQGNLEQSPPEGVDEVELLGRSFQNMALKLHQKSKEVEELRNKLDELEKHGTGPKDSDSSANPD